MFLNEKKRKRNLKRTREKKISKKKKRTEKKMGRRKKSERKCWKRKTRGKKKAKERTWSLLNRANYDLTELLNSVATLAGKKEKEKEEKSSNSLEKSNRNRTSVRWYRDRTNWDLILHEAEFVPRPFFPPCIDARVYPLYSCARGRLRVHHRDFEWSLNLGGTRFQQHETIFPPLPFFFNHPCSSFLLFSSSFRWLDCLTSVTK